MHQHRARRLGINHDARPPYIITGTPAWPQDKLADALLTAEDLLDVNLAPEDRPVLRMPQFPAAGRVTYAYPGCAAAFETCFDLDNPEGRCRLRQEPFQDIGAAWTLVLKAGNPHPFLNEAEDAVGRAVSANPFTAMAVAFACDPGVPLNIFEAARGALDRNVPSRYLERLYAPACTPRPQRRLFALLDARQQQNTNDSWLAALEDVAEIIWVATCRDERQAGAALKQVRIKPGHCLFLDIPDIPEAGREAFFAACTEAFDMPGRLLLPGLALQWAYAKFLNESA